MKKLLTTLLCSSLVISILTGCALEIRLVDTKNSSEAMEETNNIDETQESTNIESDIIEETDIMESEETEEINTEDVKLKPSEPVSIPEISIGPSTESEDETEAVDETEAADETTPENIEEITSTEEEITSTEEEITSTEEEITSTEETEVVELITISDDWTAMEFALKDSKVTIPSSLEELEKSGWYISIGEYSLKAGTRTTCDIDLIHDDYLNNDKSNFKIKIGFRNNSAKDKSISLCEIYTLQFIGIDNSSTAGLSKDLPNLEMAQGITFGSTVDDIEKAYGKPDNTYSQSNYIIYTYENNNSTMKLTVYKNTGLAKVELKQM